MAMIFGKLWNLIATNYIGYCEAERLTILCFIRFFFTGFLGLHQDYIYRPGISEVCLFSPVETTKMHVNGANGYTKNTNNGNDHPSTEHWRKRLAAAIPTLFPLRSYSLSHSIVDASIARSFLIPDQDIILNHGIALSTILTLAFGLVLRAHSDSPDEVVFGCIHYKER